MVVVTLNTVVLCYLQAASQTLTNERKANREEVGDTRIKGEWGEVQPRCIKLKRERRCYGYGRGCLTQA